MDPASPRFLHSRAGVWPVCAILVALIGVLVAAEPLFVVFHPYDDEGYMLISTLNYIHDGGLYTKTFSQYGPFYFYIQGIFFQLMHFPVTHDMGRVVTFIYWASSSLLAAFVVYRLCQSTFLASAAGLSMMLVGRVLANEPGHPQEVLFLLCMIAAGLCVPSRWLGDHLRFFLLGCLGAALAFTKINVGVFYLAGLAHAMLCLLPSGRLRSAGLGLTLTYAAVAPWLLMHRSFDLGFGRYCLVATAVGLATFISAAALRAPKRLPLSTALAAAAGVLTASAVIVVATSVQGMTLSSLLWGVIVNPLGVPDVFHILLWISWPNTLAALVLAGGFVALTLFSRHNPAKAGWFELARCAVGAASLLMLILRYEIPWVAPLLPLALIPPSRWEGESTLFPRLFITCMAATQFLEPFPVAGSQAGIAAAPMILWSFVCIADGITGLRTTAAWPSMTERLRLDAAIGGAILFLFAAFSVARVVAGPLPGAASGLKGAGWLHLPEKQATQFQGITRSVRANCKVLFSLPGMASFNLWSGVPTPNAWNVSTWMDGITRDRQAEILHILKSNPQSCAIVNHKIVGMWEGGPTAERSPLAQYLAREMPVVDHFGDYEIHVNPDRRSPWNRPKTDRTSDRVVEKPN